MTLLITGGGGLVLSHLAHHWLDSDPQATVIVLDAAPLDALAEKFFAPVRERLAFVLADVLDETVWERLALEPITHIVHGATITPSLERERARPKQILDVNLAGTVQALEFARMLPVLQRFIYVSSGAVYGDALPNTPDIPLAEDGHVAPAELYGITKYASELITRRYGELFGLDVVSVRFSGVYGPMDRHTIGREVDCVPKKIVSAALAGRTLTVKALDAGGDFIHAGDVAEALTALLRAPKLNHPVYNVAYGEFVLIRELIDIVREVAPDLQVQVKSDSEADITYDPRNRLGRWSDYAIDRLWHNVGWKPRPIREALHHYWHWAKHHAT